MQSCTFTSLYATKEHTHINTHKHTQEDAMLLTEVDLNREILHTGIDSPRLQRRIRRAKQQGAV